MRVLKQKTAIIKKSIRNDQPNCPLGKYGKYVQAASKKNWPKEQKYWSLLLNARPIDFSRGNKLKSLDTISNEEYDRCMITVSKQDLKM